MPDLDAHAGQDVIIVGGGDSACDWALSPGADRRFGDPGPPPGRRSAPTQHTVDQLLASSVEVITDAEITAVTGGERLDQVEITEHGRRRPRPARAGSDRGARVHRQPRADPRLGHRDRRQPLHRGRLRHGDQRPGVFAAGDITDYRGKVRLISVGFGEAATAVNNAAVLIHPDEQLFPGHSSDAAPAVASAA